MGLCANMIDGVSAARRVNDGNDGAFVVPRSPYAFGLKLGLFRLASLRSIMRTLPLFQLAQQRMLQTSLLKITYTPVIHVDEIHLRRSMRAVLDSLNGVDVRGTDGRRRMVPREHVWVLECMCCQRDDTRVGGGRNSHIFSNCREIDRGRSRSKADRTWREKCCGHRLRGDGYGLAAGDDNGGNDQRGRCDDRNSCKFSWGRSSRNLRLAYGARHSVSEL
jgi:hypothetical protein